MRPSPRESELKNRSPPRRRRSRLKNSSRKRLKKLKPQSWRPRKPQLKHFAYSKNRRRLKRKRKPGRQRPLKLLKKLLKNRLPDFRGYWVEMTRRP